MNRRAAVWATGIMACTTLLVWGCFSYPAVLVLTVTGLAWLMLYGAVKDILR